MNIIFVHKGTISVFKEDTETYLHFNLFFKRMEREIRGHVRR